MRTLTRYILKPNVSIFYLDDETAIIKSAEGITIRIKQSDVRSFLENFFKNLREVGVEGIKHDKDLEKLFDVLFKHKIIIGEDMLGEYHEETSPITRFFLAYTSLGGAAHKVLEDVSVGIINLGIVGSTLLKMLVDDSVKKFYILDVEKVSCDDLLSPVYSEKDIGIERSHIIKERFKDRAKIVDASDVASYLNYIDGVVDITVVTSDTSDYILLQELNSKLAPRAAGPIVYTWLDCARLFIGPIFVDGESACFEDFVRSSLINASRYNDSKRIFREAEFYQYARPAITESGLNFAVGLLSELVINLALDIIPVDQLVNKIFIADPITLSIKSVPVWHDPLCEICIKHYKKYI